VRHPAVHRVGLLELLENLRYSEKRLAKKKKKESRKLERAYH
jgi:hypothetical protein